jgi:serine/threonine protein kinase
MLTNINSYILLDEIGSGEFGKVHRSISTTQNQKEFAIKVIPVTTIHKTPELNHFIQTEQNLLSNVHHPNIIQLHQTIHSHDYLYLVYNYCSQGNLDQMLS